MSDFKLNDTLLRTSIKQRHLIIHKVRNSILRNIITPEGSSISGYEHHLKQEDFMDQQAETVLSLICCKQNYSLDDRNALRRLLLVKGDQRLVGAIHQQQFYNSIGYRRLAHGESIQLCPDEQYFWIVISGRIRYSNDRQLEQSITSKNHFGHEQLLSKANIKKIKAEQDSLLVHVPEDVFLDSLTSYFQDFINNINKCLSKSINWFENVDLYQQIHMLLSAQKLTLKPNTMICRENALIRYIYVVGSGSINQTGDTAVDRLGLIGLKQILADNQRYSHNICCTSQSEIYRFPANLIYRMDNQAYLRETLHMKFYNEAEKKEIRKRQRKFQFRIKHAKITLSRSTRKDGNQSALITNDFFFLSQRSNWVKQKLKIRKAKTESRHMSLLTEDPELPTLFTNIQ